MQSSFLPDFGPKFSFIAMEYYFGILNRTYQVFVTPTVIAGAFVTSMMGAPLTLPKHWYDPVSYASRRMINQYENISSDSRQFKQKSPFFNFQYPRSDIVRSRYDPTRKWGMGTVAHSGKLYIELRSGKQREFILLGLQQGKEILRQLQNTQNFDINSGEDIELHGAIKAAYEQPQNPALWERLRQLFSVRGEQAQEYYCQYQLAYLPKNIRK